MKTLNRINEIIDAALEDPVVQIGLLVGTLIFVLVCPEGGF